MTQICIMCTQMRKKSSFITHFIHILHTVSLEICIDLISLREEMNKIQKIHHNAIIRSFSFKMHLYLVSDEMILTVNLQMSQL